MCIYNYECDKCNIELSDCLEDLIFTDDSLNNCCCDELNNFSDILEISASETF